MPKVSVIIPAYSRPESLRRAALSVLAQTFSDLELLIVHNGPHEGPRDVAKELETEDKRVRYHFVKKADAVTARNMGVDLAAGDYIAFLDDDDEWLPEKLEKQLAVFEELPSVGMVYVRAIRVFTDGRREIDREPEQPFVSYKQLVLEGCILRTLSGVLLRKNDFHDIGPFDKRFLITNDYDFYLRFVKKFPIYYLKDALVLYACHPGNLSGIPHLRFRESVRTLRADKRNVNRHGRRLLDRGIASYGRRFYAEAVNASDEGDHRMAAYYYWKSIRYMPWVGLSITWARYSNPVYKFLQPYAAVGLSVFKAMIRKRPEKVEL
ncbi:MAG TPA: glycosyltransferase family A protein [Verrucomicrobiae bacterium]|nr:glycosyltransferase family A protein [Verrucomicrobiae bacterium]